MKNGQKGFTLIETLLVLILLSIVGFTGYYIYHTKNNANSTYNNAAKTSSTPAQVSSTKFVFKDLGIQFDPKNDLAGLKYRVDGSYYLSDTAFINALKTCPDYQAGDDGDGFAAISKASGQYPSDGSPIQFGVLLKQFSDFYISYGAPNGLGCSDTSKAQVIHDAATAERSKFVDDFQKTATLAQ